MTGQPILTNELNNSIEILLAPFRHTIGTDFVKYSNHVHRVFFNCRLMDMDETNSEKYVIAAVFHDIGIWCNNTIDYLIPSIEQAEKYLIENGRGHWVDEVSQMIWWHHKISSYSGDYEKTVETFRRADYIDVSLGLVTYGVDKKVVALNRDKFPNAGFHLFLLKKIGKNLLRHPLNPLPMFTK